MIVYMEVTEDEYELPVAVAGSSEELARIVGTTGNAIKSAISHVESGRRKKSRYVRVYVEDE